MVAIDGADVVEGQAVGARLTLPGVCVSHNAFVGAEDVDVGDFVKSCVVLREDAAADGADGDIVKYRSGLALAQNEGVVGDVEEAMLEGVAAALMGSDTVGGHLGGEDLEIGHL